MQLIVTPLVAVSSATALVKPAMACLDATYGALFGLATRLWAEAVLTIRPQPFAFIPGSARRTVWKAALRFKARIRSHFSGGNSSIGATCWVPALLTRM